MAKNTLNPCGCDSGTIPVIGASHVVYQGTNLNCIPALSDENLAVILGAINQRFCNSYTKTEVNDTFARKPETIATATVSPQADTLEFYNADNALLFEVDIRYFVSQGVILEVSGNTVVLKDKAGIILSSAALPGAGEIRIDERPFRYVVGLENDGAGLQVGDIAAGGIFEYQSKLFFGDLKCIDTTGDTSTGIGTKWQPINLTQL